MRIDASIAFVPLGSPLTILGAAIASPNTVDLLGTGVGTAPVNIIGTPSVYGAADAMGIGKERVALQIATGAAAFAGGTSLNVALQGAIDNGSYQPGTWNTFGESGALLTANLTASTVICRLPWLPPWPFNLRPRFLRLLFTPVGTFTAGAIAYALPVTGRDDYSAANAAKNFAVA